MSTKNRFKKHLSIQEAIYSRSKRELHNPSAKIGKNWTDEHTTKFKQCWNELYPNILEQEIQSLRDTFGTISDEKINTKNKKTKKTRVRSNTAPVRSECIKFGDTNDTKSTVFSANLLQDICVSLEFGLFALQNVTNERKSFESNIVSFWFSITFNVTHKKNDFLYFKYIKDQCTKKKKSNNKIQIVCDIEYAQKNYIINSKKSILPKKALIEIFKYAEPTKLLALYTYVVDIDSDPFHPKYFNMSNMGWVCNYYGLETFFVRKLFEILMTFLYSEKVENYIEKTKTYQKNWKEWQEAQLDLDIMKVHENMQNTKPKRKS